MSWKSEIDALRRKEASAPAGCQSLEEIAREIGYTEETTNELLKRLIKEGRAERVQGKKLTSTGAMIPCSYFRLIGKPADKKVGEKK